MLGRLVGVWAAVMVLASGAAVAQDFQIPADAALGAMSVEEKAAMERQLTIDALDWPLSVIDEAMIEPDIMDDLSPQRTGTIAGADDLHRASGTALVFELERGKGFVRLEEFQTVRGPGLHLYLSRQHSPVTLADLGSEQGGDFLDLGPLKAEQGNQNYRFTGNWGAYRSVVLVSRPFGVIFAVAPLQ